MRSAIYIWSSVIIFCVVLSTGCTELREVEEEEPWHLPGFTDPGSPNFHGNDIRVTVDPGTGYYWSMHICRACHGDDYDRSRDGVSCLTCHTQDQGPESCGTCHGGTVSFAPPPDLNGILSTTSRGVGAHQSHLRATHGLAEPLVCGDCHLVPDALYVPGHVDSELPAEVSFAGSELLAEANEEYELSPSWDAATLTCRNVYCHGAVFEEGESNEPVWTKTDGTYRACDSCHGNPPAKKSDGTDHTSSTDCKLCHPSVVDADGSIKDLSLHINGEVDR